MCSRVRCSSRAFPKLDAFYKRPCGTVPSGGRSVHAETDTGYTLHIFAEVTPERGAEIKFGHYRLVGLRLAQANETAAGMKVLSLGWEIDLAVVAEKESNKVRLLGMKTLPLKTRSLPKKT